MMRSDYLHTHFQADYVLLPRVKTEVYLIMTHMDLPQPRSESMHLGINHPKTLSIDSSIRCNPLPCSSFDSIDGQLTDSILVLPPEPPLPMSSNQ